MQDHHQIAVVGGDGIGPKVAEAAVQALVQLFGPDGPLRFARHPAGAERYRLTGDSFPQATLDACRAADALLHGAAGLPGVVHPDGTEAGLDFTLRLRLELDLFANIRPIRLYPGVRSLLAGVGPGQIDHVILRENSEGLYAARGAGVQLRGQGQCAAQLCLRPVDP